MSTAVLLAAAALRLWHISILPPGLHHDEAFHLLRALDIAQGLDFPVYITGNQGNDPLFAYLSAVSVLALGAESWAGRLVAALSGIVSIALTMRAGDELFHSRKIGWLCGLALAGLYWHLMISRWGSQPILSVVGAAGTVAGLAYGWRTGRTRGYVLAGVALAFGLWAYVAFRLFPLVVIAALAAATVTRRDRWRGFLAQGAALVFTSVILYAPLGWYFISHPQWFFNRYSQTTQSVLGGPQPAAALLHNLALTLGGFVVRGDLDWRQNLSGRPIFDAAQLILFCLGAAWCVWQWRRPASLTLAAWLVIGLVPSVVTNDPPQFGRSVMMTPALAIIGALGARWAADFRPAPRWAAVVAGAALVLSMAQTGVDYFFRWANAPYLFQAFDVGLQWIGRELRAEPAGTVLYETPVRRDWYTFEFTLGPEAFNRFHVFDGRQCTVVPERTRAPTTYAVLALEDPFTLPVLQVAFPHGEIIDELVRTGTRHTVIFRIPAGESAALPAATPRSAAFGQFTELAGDTLLTPSVAAGSNVDLELKWRALNETRAAYKVLVALLGPPRADGSVLYAQRDAEPCAGAYPAWTWQAGEIIVDRVKLAVPADVPPGEYQLVVAVYDSITLERLPATQAGMAIPDGLVPLDLVRVAAP